MNLDTYLAESAALIERTRRELSAGAVESAIAAIVTALGAKRPLLVCGNGGSAADAMHITGELVGRFRRERRALPCICLAADPAVLTAWANDYSFETVFARQVEAYGVPGAVLLGISTSGNAANVVAAFEKARETGMVTVALTGEGGGALGALADHLLAVPSLRTPLVQQVHICLYHYLCERVEAALL
jgi:D-sedoheptulose 7-phosphate isomerase